MAVLLLDNLDKLTKGSQADNILIDLLGMTEVN